MAAGRMAGAMSKPFGLAPAKSARACHSQVIDVRFPRAGIASQAVERGRVRSESALDSGAAL